MCIYGAGDDARLLPAGKVGVVVLGNFLVGLLGSGRAGLLDGLGNVVGGVLDGLHCDGSGELSTDVPCVFVGCAVMCGS